MRICELPETAIADAVNLWEVTGLLRPWNDPRADIQRALACPTATVLAAMEGPELLGTAMIGDDGHRGWIYYLAVQPNRQGSGIGRQLVAECERRLQARGVPRVHLMVRESNHEVVSFYHDLGYTDGEVIVLCKWVKEHP